MNKLLTKIAGLALGLSMAIGVGVAASYSEKDAVRADASDIDKTIDFTTSYSGINASASVTADTLYETTSDFDENYTFNYINCYSASGYLMCGSKAKKSATLFGNKTAMPGDISKIVVTPTSGCSGSAKWEISLGTSAFSTAISSGDQSATGKSVITYEPSSTTNLKYFGISSTSTSYNAQIASITVTYISTSTSKATSVVISGLGDSEKSNQNIGTTLQLSATVNVDSGTSDNLVTWASSNTSVATISASGLVTYAGNGTTSITATSHYDPATAGSNIGTVSLTLSGTKGIESNPLTVSEALSLITTSTYNATTTYCVSGIISSGIGTVSSGQLSFNISEDGTTSNEMQVYKVKYLNNADFTSADQVAIGDLIVVSGQFDLYNSTKEIKYGYLRSLTHTTVYLSVDKESAIIDEGSSTTITATLTNASDYENVSWSIKSGVSTYVSLSAVSGQTVTVSGVAEGSDTIVCAYGALEREISITVKEAYVPSSETFGKYAGTITAGEYIIVYDGIAMNTTVSSDRFGNTSVTATNNQITTSDSAIKWKVTANGDYWTLYNRNEGLYAASTGVKNKAKTETTITDNSRWTISGNETYEFVNKANVAGEVNANLRRNGDNGWACYSTSTGGALTLYKKDFTPAGEKTLSSLSVEGSPTKKNYTYPEAFDPSGLTVYANYTDSTTYPSEDVTSSVTWASLSIGDTSVEGSYTLGEVTKTCTVSGITVSAATQNANDKVLNATSLNLNGTSYSANDGDHTVDGDTFTTQNVMLSSSVMQFRSGKSYTNYLTNASAMLGQIKYVTVIASSSNTGTLEVCAGSSTNPTDSATLVKTSGYITVYSINANYFAVKSSSGACLVENVIVELADATTTALGNARTAASKILSGLSGLCGDGGTGNVSLAQWQAIATDVGTLDADTKAILKSATRVAIGNLALGSATIENAMFHYDAVITNFGYTDILEIGSSAAHTNTSPMIVNSETAVVIIVVIAAISVTSIGALLVLKKRKEQI